MWNKLNQSILEEEEEEDELLYDTQDLCSLTHLQRVYAFAACLLTALLLMLLSLIVFANPIKFALFFTFANLLAIGSTAFLIGPTQQTRMMFDPVRMYATAIYFGCVVLALICALLASIFQSSSSSKSSSAGKSSSESSSSVDVVPSSSNSCSSSSSSSSSTKRRCLFRVLLPELEAKG